MAVEYARAHYCPVCGMRLVWDGDEWICPNIYCGE